ncbi:MAG TPA: phosphate acyltransferase PlsX [Chloroflexia bacterium]|nr:phosphate acyltransferase PlsX [Chloroflexia bacterium]
MTVALDAMGGDYAPAVAVEGGVAAARAHGFPLLLVGIEADVQAELAKHQTAGLDIQVVHASQVIAMDEHPANAARQKTDSSIVVGMRLVKSGRAGAFVSAGNTGAMVAAGLLELGRARGVDRPALGIIFPTLRGKTLLLDVGATPDAKPEHLAQFGLMGSLYLERVFGVPNPRVGLVSIGEEEGKGNALVQQASPRMRAMALNYIGNVEGKDIPAGSVDVAVCDGFVGNVLLKFAEGLAASITGIIREELQRTVWSKLLAAGSLPGFRRARKRMDYREFGGAPLLGLRGLAIVAHGRSDAHAIQNALRVAHDGARQDIAQLIAEGIAQSRDGGSEPE